LIANVSHDLRTPLASMRGYVDTLLMGAEPADPADQKRYLKIIAGNLDHLDRLIGHTLVLSRFDSGQATFRFEDFPLSELADSVIGRLDGLAAQQQVTLSLDAGPDVGLVHADPLQIGQVLQNLLENGIKFNRPGGRVATILRAEGDKAVIEVQDNGIGITETLLHRGPEPTPPGRWRL
jgi:signal transduction histidine kinase